MGYRRGGERNVKAFIIQNPRGRKIFLRAIVVKNFDLS